MRKLILILPLLLWACSPDEIIEVQPLVEIPMDIFEVQNTVVKDGDKFTINFDSKGEYTLSLVDEFTNVTYTNEKVNGKVGSNSLRIYTQALPKGSYGFLVKNSQGEIVKQTKIKI